MESSVKIYYLVNGFNKEHYQNGIAPFLANTLKRFLTFHLVLIICIH